MALLLGSAASLYVVLARRDSAIDLYNRGAEAFYAGDYQKAVEYYLEGIEKEPDSAVGYNLLGMAYRFQYNATGDQVFKDKEIAAFRKAIELDPREHAALINLGTTLYNLGKVKEAAGYLKRGLEGYPQHPERTQIEQMIQEGEQR